MARALQQLPSWRIQLIVRSEPSLRFTWIRTLAIVVYGLISAVIRPLPAYAEDTISIEGLTLPCADCGLREDGTCEIRDEDGPVLLPCPKALDVLLERASTNYDGTAPTIAELRAFVLRPPEEHEPLHAALETAITMLLNDPRGRDAIVAAAPHILAHHSAVMTKVLSGGIGSPDLWMSLWQVPVTDGVELAPELRATIAHLHPELGIEDLIDTLSGIDTESDLRDLEGFRKTLADLGDSETEQVGQLMRLLDLCMNQQQFASDDVRCRAAAFATLPSAAREYLNGVLLRFVVSRMESEPNPVQALELLARTNVEQNITASASAGLANTLERLISVDDPATRVSATDGRFTALFRVFGASDPHVRDGLGALFTKAADEAIEAGEVSRGLDILEKSFELHPASRLPRTSLILNLPMVAAIQSDPALAARVAQLIARVEEGGANESIRLEPLALAASALLIVVGLLLIFVAYRRRRLTSLATGSEALSSHERAELRTLLAFFGLDPMTDEAELSRVYRTRAKELHPDTGQGMTEDFVQLSDNYRRARELLERRKLD